MIYGGAGVTESKYVDVSDNISDLHVTATLAADSRPCPQLLQVRQQGPHSLPKKLWVLLVKEFLQAAGCPSCNLTNDIKAYGLQNETFT